MQKSINPLVKEKLMTYPVEFREKILQIRELIIEKFSENQALSELTETLKWNEPSYLPKTKNIGTTVRLAWLKSKPNQFGIYFNCQTDLIKKIKLLYGDTFSYEGNRALIFNKNDKLPKRALKDCINMALTYHISKKKN